MEPERRFTDQEFAAIMRAAAGAQPPPGRTLPTHAGLTLAEVQAIAAEVGVAPAAVARVARTLPLRPESERARLAGGPVTLQLEFSLAAGADEDAANRAVEAVRRITAQQGSARRTGSVLEWRNDPQLTSLAINVTTTAESRTRVSILIDRRGTAGLISALSVVGAGIAFGITGAILEPTGLGAVGGLALGIGGTAAIAARTMWTRSTHHYRTLLARLTTALAEALEPSGTPRA